MNTKRSLGLIFVTVFVAACSTPDYEYKGVYEKSKQIQALDLPPGLTKPNSSESMVLPELGTNTYSDYQQNTQEGKRVSIPAEFKGAKFIRDGGMAWLEVDAPPAQVFNEVRSFITKVGFDIVSESATLGIMETNWKDNIADIPQGWLSSLLNPFYRAEARDRYRIRLEPSDNGNKTRLFIAHQGLREKVEGEDNGIDAVQTKWILTPADPDLEAEMLMRFMIYRGVDKKVARNTIENAPVEQRTVLHQDSNGVNLEIKQPFARAWRHVGLALDRMGLQVEDRNRSAGVYYIRIPDNLITGKGSDWFRSVYTGDEKLSNVQLLINVEDKGDSSLVTLRGRETQPENISKIAENFLKQLQSNII